MYGLEKDQPNRFKFDLEQEIIKEPNRAKELIKKVEENIHAIKAKLKSGSSGKEQEELKALLEGYIAVERVLKRVKKG